MKSVILAAGTGNRLKPITDKIPKCLVEIGGKTLLSWQIDSLTKGGVSEINIVTGYKSDEIKKLRETKIKNMYHNQDYLSTNMVKSLLSAQELFDTDLIISYSDIIYSSGIVSKLLECKHDNAIIVDLDWYKLWSQRFNNPLDDAETLTFDRNFNLIDIGKKPKDIKDIMAQYIGLMKFNTITLNLIKRLNLERKINDNYFMTDLISLFLKKDINIKVIPIRRGWLEIDSKSDLLKYRKELDNQNKQDIFKIFN